MFSVDFMEQGAPVSAGAYCIVLDQLRAAIKQKFVQLSAYV